MTYHNSYTEKKSYTTESWQQTTVEFWLLTQKNLELGLLSCPVVMKVPEIKQGPLLNQQKKCDTGNYQQQMPMSKIHLTNFTK